MDSLCYILLVFMFQCLSSTTAFSYAAQYIARYEEQIIGIQWSNVKEDPLFDDGFSFEWCCIMILIDAAIYFILGWYVRNVKPGEHIWLGLSSGDFLCIQIIKTF